jgi:predicted flap endonuclease-1-like 5' DNA nuclease
MGIITMDDGKLKTHRVGARAAGTGAKWGTILGATGGLATGAMAAAGILTGGIGLIPGAIAGLAVGAAGGALFHKRIGMTDADRQRIHDHLAGGGAALAVMADANEVEPTKAEIAALGGNVEHFVIPEELMAEFEETRERVAEVQEEVAERFADHPLEVQEDVALWIAAATSLTSDDVAKLQAAGIADVNGFLAKASSPGGREELAKATGYNTQTILTWANEVDLARVRGVGPAYAALLKAAGVDTVPELAQRNAANLATKLAEVNAAEGIADDTATEEQVAFWIAQAKELPRVITY